MATILLSAAGAAIGSGFGGTVLGMSGAVIGRALGATIGRGLDQRILGAGSQAVETGKVSAFRLTGASYGTPVKEVWGRMRVSGQVIWASRFNEIRQTSGGGKGSPQPTTTSFTYTVSLAIALCRGKALRVGRIWADGEEIAANSLALRFYSGSEDQLPDPKIEAVEGVGLAPAYRGIAYVVIEDLVLTQFGNRVPQFSFEVVRNANEGGNDHPESLSELVRAVALIPGTGEYSLATTPVHYSVAPGKNISTNVHTVQGRTDFDVSLTQLNEELPKCGSVSLVVSWFGDDLRCGHCQIRPKVEQKELDAENMPWVVSGLTRAAAQLVPKEVGRSVYGGTPSDRSVIEAIAALREAGKEVMFYPFILMEQTAGNGLPDPWSDSVDQPALPWRGRITLAKAPGQQGSNDQTSAAASEVSDFLGQADPLDFSSGFPGVSYTGPDEWSYRRFILHYAHLCALAGGVEAFCIGSEMRGLTWVRSGVNSFPMVDALKTLAGEVKAILGNETKITYAADWSEYFGLHSGSDVFFHLDPLWADENIDFIGIDNYMPVSDWREGNDHADSAWPSIYDLGYLEGNIAGGEGFDWYYENAEAVEHQVRTPIVDGAYGEEWVFRYKDLKGWWSNKHHDRIGGVRQLVSTAWTPGMKPIRFTEYGCAALDKATNEPNKFIDPKSSESALPRASNGGQNDYLQSRYLLAMSRFWSRPENNPEATLFSGRMLDLERCHVWAWDARPYPEFPGNLETWSDGFNYRSGHWLNGRTSGQTLSSVLSEIANFEIAGDHLDHSRLHGSLRGFAVEGNETPRAKLQAIAVPFSVDNAEFDGKLQFFNRNTTGEIPIDDGQLVDGGDDASIELSDKTFSDAVGRVRLTFHQADNDFEIETAEAVFPDESENGLLETELALLLTAPEANAIADRCLAEARLARERATLMLPPSFAGLTPGVTLLLNGRNYRIDHLDDRGSLRMDAVRVDGCAYLPVATRGDVALRTSPVPTTPVYPVFLDLPLMQGSEVPHAPHVAVAASPWPGSVTVWSSTTDTGYIANVDLTVPSLIGITLNELLAGKPGLWDYGSRMLVSIPTGQLSSTAPEDVLNGANLATIGDSTGANWELIQFTSAVLVEPDTYELSGLLRGLAGTDAVAPEIWPEGSHFVLIDVDVPQLSLSVSARGLERNYRIGATSLGYTDANIVQRREAFPGIGLRPYSVSHLRVQGVPLEELHFTWIRRTRINGDSWSSAEVPLGEEAESYRVQVVKDSLLIREENVSSPTWMYSAAAQASDMIIAPFEVRVSQLSAAFGPGPDRSIIVG